MGWVDALKGSTVALDTAPLIYYTEEIAEEAARLRAFHKIRTPDSIQMATGIMRGATYFLTNDLKLPSLPELKALRLDELKTLPEYLTPDSSQ